MSRMNRRTFIKTVGVTFVTALPYGCHKQLETVKAPQKPNVLFLFTDDQRYDTIAALGNRHIKTPNLDTLVHGGTAFERGYIMGGNSGAVCMPSRAMVNTGRNLFSLKASSRLIPESIPTMGQVFTEAGCQTFFTGKWHQDTKSFNRSYAAADNIFFGGMHDHFEIPLSHYDPTAKYPRDARVVKKGKHSSELFADAAVDFLKQSDRKSPFFAFVSFTAPHDPRQTPQKYREMYDAEKLPLPANFLPEHTFDNGELKIRDEQLAAWPRTPQEVRGHIRDYYAMITHLDEQIGRVLDALRKTGQYDNTIIVFTSDNGLALGSHGLMGKQNLYEHSIRVPLVICGPGVAADKKTDAMTYLYDLFPTLCEMTGLSIPETVQGQSLKPVLDGDCEIARTRMVFAYKNFQRAYRNRRWKTIYYNVGGQMRTQLFDLKNDPDEKKDLAALPKYQNVLEKMNRQAQQTMKKYGDTADLSKPGWGVPEIPAWPNEANFTQTHTEWL